jgi:hypothetical protein
MPNIIQVMLGILTGCVIVALAGPFVMRFLVWWWDRWGP